MPVDAADVDSINLGQMTHICVELFSQQVLSQFLCGEDRGINCKGRGHVPLPCPAQSVQGAHDRPKCVLNATNGNAVF